MSDVAREFLALKRASSGRADAGDSPRHHSQQNAGGGAENAEQPAPSREASSEPAESVRESDLSGYFEELLAAHPSARPVRNRQALADYLARGIIHRYGNPQEVLWDSGRPVTARTRPKIPWTTQCPAGHLTDEALESNQVVGIVCEACQRVYDAKECKLVLRKSTGITEQTVRGLASGGPSTKLRA